MSVPANNLFFGGVHFDQYHIGDGLLQSKRQRAVKRAGQEGPSVCAALSQRMKITVFLELLLIRGIG